MMQDKIIYMDSNSTTRIDSAVFNAMLPYLKDNFANSSSTHFFGQHINEKVQQARQQIADFVNAESKEIIFTSGATEAINAGIKGVAESYSMKGKNIVTVDTEHKAVLDACKYLESKGYEITYLKVDTLGLIDLKELELSIRPDTILVSVMYVNNETGVIQPIKEIASITQSKGALFMSDATQAVGKIPIDLYDLNVDILCFSGHKMYAPKGIGALFIRKREEKLRLTPQIHGGGHEQGLRRGTLNVPGIIALGEACTIAANELKENTDKIKKLRDKLETELLKIPNTKINGHTHNRIYNTSNICFNGQDANVMIGRMKDIAVSNGSACSSAIIEPSHVLKAMGLADEDAFASLRFSLCKYNTLEEVELVINKIGELTQTNNIYA